VNLHKRIREATRGCHEKIEDVLQSERILSPDIDLDEYRKHLRALYSGHARVEAGLIHFKAKLEAEGFSLPAPSNSCLISKDLEALNDTNISSDQSPTVLNNHLEAIGALYVIKGSAMGRAMIARRLAPKIGEWGLSEPHYYAIQSQGQDEWMQFVQKLETMTPSDVTTRQTVTGAVAAFESFVPSHFRCSALDRGP